VGLVCVLAAKAAGATTIIVSDINAQRLSVAAQLGATHTVNAAATDFGDQVRAATGGAGADVTMDASGAEPAIKSGMLATRAGGKYVSIGRGAKDLLALPFFEVMDKEIDLLGVFRYRNTYAKSIALLASKRIDVTPLITHTFTLDQVQEAFETAEVGKGNAIKVMLTI
jgi:L-iditol 2-dehydrogenase